MKQFQLLIAALFLTAVCASAMSGTLSDSQLRSNYSVVNRLSGTILTITDSHFTVQTRTELVIQVDATEAIKNYRSVQLVLGENVNVLGKYDINGVLHANLVRRAKSADLWEPDQ